MEECTSHIANRTRLFTGGEPWYGNWKNVSTQQVGGIGYCNMTLHTENGQTEMHGWLDRRSIHPNACAAIETSGNDKVWDLSAYDGLALNIARSDGKIYKLALEDEQKIGFEWTFRCDNPKGLAVNTTRVLRFSTSTPERDLGDRFHDLNFRCIRKIRLAIQNTHHLQEGVFKLSIGAIDAVRITCDCLPTPDPVLARLHKGGLGVTWGVYKRRVGTRFRHILLQRRWKREGRRGYAEIPGAKEHGEDGRGLFDSSEPGESSGQG